MAHNGWRRNRTREPAMDTANPRLRHRHPEPATGTGASRLDIACAWAILGVVALIGLLL